MGTALSPGRIVRLVFAASLLFLLTGCSGSGEADYSDAAGTGETAPPPADHAAPAGQASGAGGISGEVLQTMDSGGYTYVQVATADGEVWAAGPRTVVTVGDQVSLFGGTEMHDFHSKTLERDFASIWFVTAIRTGGETGGEGDAAPTGMPADEIHRSLGSAGDAAAGHTSAPRDGAEVLEKAPGGLSVAEIHDRRSELAGRSVTVRGRVVKFNANIMGSNWVHLQDGTGGEGSYDLTVTTADRAAVGDIVVAEGVLAVDRDFGSGYRYEVILEKAILSGK